MGSAGIAYLRGYLKSKNIKSDYLNINDEILSNVDDEKVLNKYFSHIYPKIEKENTSKFEINKFYNLFAHIFWQGNQKFWEIVNDDEHIKILLEKYYKNLSYEIVAFSNTTLAQLFFSIASAKYIKENISKDIKIVFGGPRVMSDAESLIGLLEKNKYVDYFVEGEGEIAIYEIVKDESGSSTPGLIYINSKGEYTRALSNKCFETIDYKPPLYEPDGTPVIRGSNSKCYWGRCSFCGNYSKGTRSNKFVERKVEDIIRDIKEVSKVIDWKNKLFFFSDSAMPVELLDSLSRALLKEKNVPDKFRVNMRFDQRLTRDILIRAKQAGFGKGEGNFLNRGVIVFGWETTTPRLQKLMQRGQTNSLAESVVRRCLEAGVNIKLNLIGGLPTQTENEFKKELIYIKKLIEEFNTDNLVIDLNPFLLLRDSEIYHKPEKFNIKIIEDRPFFPCVFEQLDPEAITPVKAIEIYENFVNSLEQNFKRVFVKWNNQFPFLVKKYKK